jgi:hypothetical protein
LWWLPAFGRSGSALAQALIDADESQDRIVANLQLEIPPAVRCEFVRFAVIVAIDLDHNASLWPEQVDRGSILIDAQSICLR